MQKVVDLMARYIDSEQVVRELLSLSVTDGLYGRGLSRGIELALSIVNRQDTADVVEVVRCRDCKRCFEKRTKRNKQLMRFCMRMDGNEYRVKANGFCSYGERRTDNDL